MARSDSPSGSIPCLPCTFYSAGFYFSATGSDSKVGSLVSNVEAPGLGWWPAADGLVPANSQCWHQPALCSHGHQCGTHGLLISPYAVSRVCVERCRGAETTEKPTRKTPMSQGCQRPNCRVYTLPHFHSIPFSILCGLLLYQLVK